MLANGKQKVPLGERAQGDVQQSSGAKSETRCVRQVHECGMETEERQETLWDVVKGLEVYTSG